MKSVLIRLIYEEYGQGLIEYSLLVSFIAILLVLALKGVGHELLNSLLNSKNQIVKAIK